MLAEAKLKGNINTGITFGELPGIINPFHELAACNAANYRYFGDWQELTGDQKAVLVAHYYTGIMIENHKQDAQNQEMDRLSKKRSGRSKGKKTK